MAIRFARQPGNWSDPLTWDDGLTIPTTGDEVYLNGYNVTIDQDITTGFIANSITPIGVPLDPIPDMTSNISPVGVGQAFATQDSINAWRVFRKGLTTFSPSANPWVAAVNSGQIGYQFDTPKSIQRYAWYQNSGTGSRPKDWTFEGSNDGVTWVTLHTVVAAANFALYNSPNISNPSSYTYYRINVTAVQLTGYTLWLNALSMTESTSFVNGYLSGGTATISTSRTVNADLYHSTGTLITISATSPDVVNITGNIPGILAGTSSNGINCTGNATLNFVGNITPAINTFINSPTGIRLSTSQTLNITGDILGGQNFGSFGSTASPIAIRSNSNSTINMVGNITGSLNGIHNYGILGGTNGIINITGQVYGGYSTSLSSGGAGIALGGNETVNMVGNVSSGTNSIGITGVNNGSKVKLYGNAINNSDGLLAVLCSFCFIESTNMSWEFRKLDLTTNTLYTPGVATGHPAEANVRTGITYGPTNNLTGTCAVPPAAAVSIGVPVDNTVGTAYLNATDIWNVPLASITTPNSIGERLKDASTVQSTGAQLAAFL